MMSMSSLLAGVGQFLDYHLSWDDSPTTSHFLFLTCLFENTEDNIEWQSWDLIHPDLRDLG